MNPLAILNKYHDPSSQEYQILITHSILVAQKAINLSLRYIERQKKAVDLKFIYEASMLHDVGFGFPKFAGWEKNDYLKEIKKKDFYLGHGYWGAEILRKERLPKHARVAENHMGLGIKKEEIKNNKWPLPYKDVYPKTIEEKIISYADLFYSKKTESFLKEESKKDVVEEIKKFDFGEKKAEIFKQWDKTFR